MSKTEFSPLKIRWAVGLACLMGLVLVYLNQNAWFYKGFYDTGAAADKVPDFEATKFFFSKYFRFLLNDSLALGILWALFQEKKYMSFAFVVFLLEAFVMMPVYTLSAIWFWDETKFFISHLHRLVVNPFFMMLLIPAFFYQKSLATENR